MSATDAVVVRKADNTIDSEKSYITIIDQGQTWYEATNEQGDSYEYKGGVDVKMTFRQLKAGNYVPFTFKEFQGTDPFDKTEYSFSHTAETISIAQLWGSAVTANYGISDIYAIVRDSHGNEIFKHAVRCTSASTFTLKFIEKAPKNVPTVETWGKLEFEEGETYTLTVVAQLSTGERPTVYTGNLITA